MFTTVQHLFGEFHVVCSCAGIASTHDRAEGLRNIGWFCTPLNHADLFFGSAFD